MGRRSRKRTPTSAPPAPPVETRPPAARTPQRAASSRARLSEAPKAPWSPFPLVELTILLGIVLIVVGVVAGGGRRGLLLGCGFALVTIAGLELSLREHFSGYRSHSTLLAGAAAVIVDVPLFFLTGLPQEVLLGVGILTFVACLFALRAAFRRRTGGVAFRA